MRKFLKLVALCLLPGLLLSGCWSYRSLNDISIVMGMSMDKGQDGGFRISSEIADLSKPLKDSAPGSKLIVSEGRTIFEAVRNAKKRLQSRLYIGNVQVMIISEELAREAGITSIVDWFMRDAECRETVNLVIAKGSSAGSLLSLEGTDQTIVSLDMDKIITEDGTATSSTAYVELYEAFFTLHCSGASLVLPAFHATENDDARVIEANGIAAFHEDKLVGFLTPEESKFFLIATNQCHGGILPLSQDGSGRPDTSLEISDSKAETSFQEQGGQVYFQVKTETDVFLAETMGDIDVLSAEEIKALEEEAGKVIQQGIERLIQMVQADLKTDIFSFGHRIYQRDVRLWEKLEPDWDAIFPTLQVEVTCKVNIKNTAFIKTKEVIEK